MNINQIFENNQNWIIKQLEIDQDYFDKLGKGQSPEFLYIGCSDSRVSAEELMGLEPGKVFVHRNIANMVPNTDLNSMSVINYAVVHLKVNHIVVCGHYGCGGVLSAMQQSDLGILNPWLRNIRDVYRLHQKTLDKITNEEEKYKKLVELNVQEQCVNVIKTPEVQRAFRQRNLKVYGWIFDIHSGKLIDLNINFDEIVKDITQIYKIAD
jgi:carbonic anhydrase